MLCSVYISMCMYHSLSACFLTLTCTVWAKAKAKAVSKTGQSK